MSRKKPPQPEPQPLSAEAESIRKALEARYDLSGPGTQALLLAGLKAFDTMREAEAILRRDGLVVPDRYGTPKAHPAVDIAHRARGQWMSCLRVGGLAGWDDGGNS